MKGIFGDMFDLNGSGGLDPAELAGDYAFADEVLNEDKNGEETAEIGEAGSVEKKFEIEKTEARFEVKVWLPALESQLEKVAQIFSDNSVLTLNAARTMMEGAETVACACKTLEGAQRIKGELERVGAVVQLSCIKSQMKQKSFNPVPETRLIREQVDPVTAKASTSKLNEEISRKQSESGASKQTEDRYAGLTFILMLVAMLTIVFAPGEIVVAIVLIILIIMVLRFIYG